MAGFNLDRFIKPYFIGLLFVVTFINVLVFRYIYPDVEIGEVITVMVFISFIIALALHPVLKNLTARISKKYINEVEGNNKEE